MEKKQHFFAGFWAAPDSRVPDPIFGDFAPTSSSRKKHSPPWWHMEQGAAGGSGAGLGWRGLGLAGGSGGWLVGLAAEWWHGGTGGSGGWLVGLAAGWWYGGMAWLHGME